MSLKRIGYPERIITHGVLVAGAIIFSFPFIWLLLTSVKVQDEMSPDKVRFLPTAPRPQAQTPYIDSHQYSLPEKPDGIPDSVWNKVLPVLEKRLGETVKAWQPQTPGPDDNPSPGELDEKAYRTEIVQGLLYHLSGIISDEARSAALEVEKKIRAEEGKGEVPSERDLVKELSDRAIDEGVRAILSDSERLMNENMMREVFDSCYRRMVLGRVRVRTTDYSFHELYTGSEWKALKGDAKLVSRFDTSNSMTQEARINYGSDEKTVAFELSAAMPVSEDSDRPISGGDIDRIFIGYRPDNTWAEMIFEVIKSGELYRTEKKLYTGEFLPLEQELRWSNKGVSPMAEKLYLILHPAGKAPEDSPEFAIRIYLTKSSHVGAWYGKITKNYSHVFKPLTFWQYIATSFSLSIICIVLAIFSCTITAYAFARLQWPGRNLCFTILLATMMIPRQVIMIPNFLVYKHLGFYNTLVPMWLPALFGFPFFIFLLRQFFKNIPKDLEDAARIDGCGFLRIYWHVMLPLVKPTIATISIFTFMGVWNNFMGPLIYLNDERLYPLAMGVFKLSLVNEAQTIGVMMAGSFLMTLPIIILFFFVQRYFIQGVSLTGMKQ